MEDMLSDPRFAHVARDPKFRRIPKAERKVKIDKRFQSMFKDKKFAVKYTVDKRGRPVSQTSSENLRKYYDISSSEDESKEPADSEKDKKLAKKNKKAKKNEKKGKHEAETIREKKSDSLEEKHETDKQESEEDSDDNCFSSNGELLRIKPKEQCDLNSEDDKESSEKESESDNESANRDLIENEKQLHVRRKNENTKLTEEVKQKLRDLSVNYARGEGVLLTDSSSEEESSEYSDDEEIEHNWGELDKEAETTEEATHRLAVCNMDWDRIRAVDLMVLFNSFLPSGGLIHSVTVYPSEFGIQRMKEEEISGPKELREADKDVEDENEEGSQYHMEKLRQYQLNRLKYYYAVVVFDSAETANKVYTECDGTEYESTATKLDLRFIPDDMTFDQEPRETCDKVPELSKYQPRQFTTTALQQVKVQLTWDETNPERREITQKLSSGKLDEVDERDLQAYLASATSEDESDTDEKPEEKQVEEETNEDPIEKYKSLLKSIEEQEEAKKKKEVELEFTWGLGAKEKTEKLVKERMKKEENLTPFEQYLEKRKAKRKAKKDERKKQKDNEDISDSDDSVPSDIDLSDPYFKEELNGTKPRKKQKETSKRNVSNSEDDEEKQRKAELELLLMDKTEDENKRHFNIKELEQDANLSKSKRKRLNKKKNKEEETKEDDFELNVKDPRFTALFTSHHFNIDPADPHYRKTKGTEALIQEKLKRRADGDVSDDAQAKHPKTDKKLNPELRSLVNSVKRNVKNRPTK